MRNINIKFNPRAIFFSAIFAYLILKIFTFFSAYHVWDDAFIFVRYADNILRHGVVAFNNIHGPAYGLTSMGFLSVVIPCRLVFPNSPALTMISASCLCGIAFIFILIALLKKYSFDSTKIIRLNSTVIILILTSIVFSMNTFANHFVSGMDTTFTLLYLSIYFIIKKHHDGKPSVVTMLLVGLCGGLAFSMRPDLLIYTIFLPLADIFFPDGTSKRAFSVGILLITFIITALQILIYNSYFHSPLPLPFYCKGLHLYGNSIYSGYRHVAIIELISYVYSNIVLFLVIFISFLVHPKKWLAKLPTMHKGLLAATFLFTLYYLFFVLQIMHYFSRFYYPTLPALCLLTAYSIYFVYNDAPFIPKINIIRIGTIFSGIIMLFSGVLLAVFFISHSPRSNQFNFNISDIHKETTSNYWFCLDQFSQLPDDLSIATTELGYPLALNPHKVIIDLSGLNETQIAHEGFHSERFFAKYRPDLIYLPHPDYKDMISGIEKNIYFKRNYDYYPASTISAKLGIAIKKSSAHYLEMKNLIEANSGN